MLIKTYLTAGVAAKAKTDINFKKFIDTSINRHFNGDYGETCPEDAELNKQNPLDSMSTYKFDDDLVIWIKQEGECVIVLFPNEY